MGTGRTTLGRVAEVQIGIEPHAAASAPPRRPPAVRVGAALAIVAIVGLTALLYLSLQPQPVHLALAFEPGTSTVYRVNLAMDAAPPGSSSTFRMQETADVTWRVRSVDRNGTATVEAEAGRWTLSIGGSPATRTLPVSRWTVRVAADGRVLASGDPVLAEGAGPGGGLPGLDHVFPVLPVRDVKPGSTWTRDSRLVYLLGSGEVASTSNGRFLRYEGVSGTRAVVVRTTVRSPISLLLDAGPREPASGTAVQPTVNYLGSIVSSQTAWIDPGAGRLIRTSESGRFDLTLTPKGFPAVFPSFDPGVAPSDGVFGLPFAGGPGQDQPANPDLVVLQGTFTLSLRPLG
jgi:hypothetical protein